jgi:hypothetical protein
VGPAGAADLQQEPQLPRATSSSSSVARPDAGRPDEMIDRAKARGVYRTTFSADQRRAMILAGGVCATAWRSVCCSTTAPQGFAQGGPVQALRPRSQAPDDLREGRQGAQPPDPRPGVLARPRAADPRQPRREPHHYLMPRKGNGNGASKVTFPDEPMGVHGMHDWWYRCLANAGIVPEGTTSGENMHKARHSAGQKLLDHTGNLKAVQMLLGHESIQTTGDIYVGWDEQQLAASLMDALKREEEDE